MTRRRVMLWGLSGDPPFDAIRRELARVGAPHVVLDQRTMEDDPIDPAGVGAIFLRPYDARLVRDDVSTDYATIQAAQACQFERFAWAEVADALVINRPSAMASNSSKPFQAELIRRNGFDIPATIVTTSPDDARDFIARHGHAIYKSVSDARSTITRVDALSSDGLADVANCPTQFQAHISGTDWRVHVVGDDVFACEIHCAADDYRCAVSDGIPLEMRSASLPEHIAARCHSLSRALNLPVCGIDLRRSADDRWYCFEANPAPVFTYYEAATSQPLTAAIVAVLLAACASRPARVAA